jgi:Lysyl oxidase
MIPQNVTNSQFRMRARLDLPETPPAARQLLLPNLQVNPPWDVSFTGPVPPYGIATANVGGQSLWSCSPDETALHGSTRCLRFSTGPENTGSGPYEARFDLRQGTISAPNESNLTGPGILTGVVTQRIYRSDGTHVDRNAGRWQFHPAHAHYHVQNMLSYKLYAVKDAATGKVAQVGTGAKASFCTFNIAMINWTTFTSAPSQWRDLSVCYPPAGSTEVDMGISPGWSDVYTWDLADQYVDFSAGGEGEYVIQVEVNPEHTILTSNPNDNYGYALVKVEGDRVQMIERGQGTSPWDPHKVVLDPMGP